MTPIFPNPPLIPVFVILYAGAGLLWYAQYWFATRPGGRVFTGFTFQRGAVPLESAQALGQVNKPFRYEYETPGRSKFLTTIDLLPRSGEIVVMLSINRYGSGGMDNYAIAVLPSHGPAGQIDFKMSAFVPVAALALTFAMASVFGLGWITLSIGALVFGVTWFRARGMCSQLLEGLRRLPLS